MASRFSFELSENARNDLDDIVSYISVSLSNPAAATHFIEEFQNAMEEVRDFPESWSLVENEFVVGLGVRKKIVSNYIMYYLPISKEEKIYVVRIVYEKRNMSEILMHIV